MSASVDKVDEYECDKCGKSVGNGGIDKCMIVSDLDPDNIGMVRNLHFCRELDEEGKTVGGCVNSVLNKNHLKHHGVLKEKRAALAIASEPVELPEPEAQG